MLSWLITFREVETGELVAVKLKAHTITDARQQALTELHERLGHRVHRGSWTIFAISRTRP